MNNDRISEVYKGEIWSLPAQEKARRRIDWMVGSAAGHHVLDIGTSQGIAAILLGREGFEVVGVDVQDDRIAYAREDLSKESPATQSRVRFEVTDGAALPYEDGTFDTVLLGEVIEHLIAPERLLGEAERVLKPGGRLVLTTPFGVLHHHDHRQTYYAGDLYSLISSSIGISSGDIVDGYFRVIAVKGQMSDPDVLGRLRDASDRAVRGIQEDLASLKKEALSLKRALESAAKSEADATAARGTIAYLEGRMDQKARDLVRVEEALRLERRRIVQLERANLKLELDVATEEWKLESLRRRRWWRLGEALGSARRGPRGLIAAPVRAFRAISSAAPALPRPTLDSLARIDEAVAGRLEAPVVPCFDVACVSVVSDSTFRLLEHEMLVFRLSEESWREQLANLNPHVLVVEPAVGSKWADGAIADLLAAAGEANVRRVAWSTTGSDVARLKDLDIDVVISPIEPAGAQRDWIAARGLIQPKLHRPVRAGPPTLDSAVVDPEALRIDGVPFPAEADFLWESKRYKVVRLEGDPAEPQLARLVASGATLINPHEQAWGFHAADGEDADLAERSLLRSASIRARLAHPQLRSLVRERTVTHDVAVALGVGEDRVLTPQIDVMVPTKRPDKLENLLDNLARQTYPNLRLFLVAHGVQLDEALVNDLAAERGVELATIENVPESVALGDVFNIGFSHTESEIVAKMDDDDYYGPEYLWDSRSALHFSGADVVGKWAHYVYLGGPDLMIYRFEPYEHRFTEVVAISTLVMKRSVLDSERFPPMPFGSGSVFLKAIGALGALVYASDRWNYVYMRGDDGETNTFPVTDMKLMGNSDVVCRGLNLAEVTV